MMVSTVWLISEIVLSIVKRSGKDSTRRDRASNKIIWAAIFPSIGVGIYLGNRGIGYIRQGYPWLAYIGLALIILGIVIRWNAILTLKRYFTVDVAITKDHKIIDQGIYKYIRHPSYAGSLISFLGLGLTFSNWLSVIVIVIPIMTAFLYRVKVEEEALLEAFGDDYRAYMDRTKRLILGIY